MNKAKIFLVTGIILSGVAVFLLSIFLPFLGFLCLPVAQGCDILIIIPMVVGVIAVISIGSSGVVYLLSKGKRMSALLVALVIITIILYFVLPLLI